MNIIFSAQSLAIKPFFDVASKITSKDNIGILLSDHKYSLNLLKEKRIMQKNFFGDWSLSRDFNYKKSLDLIDKYQSLNPSINLMNGINYDRRIIFHPSAQFSHSYKKSNLSHQEKLSMLADACQKVDVLFERINPDLCYGFLMNTIFDFLLAYFSNVKNINYLNLRPSRIENYFFFESSIFDPPLRIQKKYDLDENLDEFLEWEKDQINENKEFRKYEGVEKVDFRIKFKLIKQIRNTYQNLTSKDSSSPNLLMQQINKKLIQPLRKIYQTYNFNFVSPKDLDNKTTYILFPLHYEPEVQLLSYSAPNSDQLDVIKKISLSLPIGCKLLVKEHPLMIGRRKSNFLNEIIQLGNTLIVDPSHNVNKYLKYTNLVVTLGSSVSIDALMKNIPVITIGSTLANIFDDQLVTKLDSFQNLYQHIRQALSKDLVSSNAELKILKMINVVKTLCLGVDFYSKVLGRKGAHEVNSSDYESEINKIYLHILELVKENDVQPAIFNK